MITVYTKAYNEELMVQFMVDHYRARFHGCHIVLYDNMSSDNTVAIAEQNGCEVIPFDTNGEMSDRRIVDIKNSCWKDAPTDWVVVCDLDELVDIDAVGLGGEEAAGATIIRTEGYNMVNMEDDFDIAGMKYGAREKGYDKSCVFNKRFIADINYEVGCHTCNPVGKIAYSKNRYKLYHYIFINENFTVQRYRENAARLSQENLKRRWSRHYLYTEDQIRDKIARTRRHAVKVR